MKTHIIIEPSLKRSSAFERGMSENYIVLECADGG